ncbi:ClpA/ClpB-like protein [Paraburkholderia sp. BL18I3N2]|nr:ClpA/ClpB-like protein [Paraburkholderia sp. BL18I3N2]
MGEPPLGLVGASAAAIRCSRPQRCECQERNPSASLMDRFRPEFLNRVDEVVVFHALGKEQIRRIVDLQLARVRRTALAQGIDLSFDDGLRDHLAQIGYDPEFGARMLKRKIRLEVESQLADALLRGDVRDGDKVTMTYDSGTRSVLVQKGASPTEAPSEASTQVPAHA